MIRRKQVFLLLLFGVLILLYGCKKNPREEVRGLQKWTLVRDCCLIFPDGMKVSEWRDETGEQKQYLLEDGTELLLTASITRFTPETAKKGLTGIESMTKEVQQAVLSYYEEQGTVFDTDECLKKAYQDYCTSKEAEEKFMAHIVRQEVMPTAENDTYVAFLTALTIPKQEHFTGDTVCRYDGRIFSREDGQQISLKELFVSDDWEAVKKELSILCANDDTTITDPQIYETMDQADILVFQDYLEVWFPYGTWEKQEFDKGFGLKYERLAGLLKEWAIPSGNEIKEA